MTWQKAVKNGWKVDVKSSFEIFSPNKTEVTVGYSGARGSAQQLPDYVHVKMHIKCTFTLTTVPSPVTSNCVTHCCAGEIQTTNGKSDAIANTVANAYTISLAVPP